MMTKRGLYAFTFFLNEAVFLLQRLTKQRYAYPSIQKPFNREHPEFFHTKA